MQLLWIFSGIAHTSKQGSCLACSRTVMCICIFLLPQHPLRFKECPIQCQLYQNTHYTLEWGFRTLGVSFCRAPLNSHRDLPLTSPATPMLSLSLDKSEDLDAIISIIPRSEIDVLLQVFRQGPALLLETWKVQCNINNGWHWARVSHTEACQQVPNP